MSRTVIRQSKPRTIVDKWETNAIHIDDWGTFGAFLKARTPSWDSRHTPEEKEAKDRRTFGTCVGCGHKFDNNELIHFTQSVYKNGKCIGNRFSCTSCAVKFNEATDEVTK